MAIASFGFACRSSFHFHSPLIYCVRKVRRSSIAAVETIAESESLIKDGVGELIGSSGRVVDGDRKAPGWKKMSSKDLGITRSMIAKQTGLVLDALRKKGYEVYLVGGCVRDLILKRIPKDFDIITSAELKEVMKTFPLCEIVGNGFPSAMCMLMIQLWRLMLDPFANVVYDYVGGMEDIRKAKMRTVIPASTSFQEDCARILRAVRIAARLGFRFTRETALSLKDLSCLILRLDKGRLLMEMNYMLAFGSAESSLRLLWKFGLLEILLPIQAAYFVRQGFRRRDKRSNMLLSLFSNLDQLLAPNRPCHSTLWISILAFHKALEDQPRDPLVVAAFCLAIYSGGDLVEAVKIARRISQPYDPTFCELLEQNLDSDKELMNQAVDLAASIESSLCKMTDEHFVSQAMANYPQAPYSNLVFIPLSLSSRVCKVFECVRVRKVKGFVPKQDNKIDYELLALGSLQEIRQLFSRIVFDTVYPVNLNQDYADQNDNMSEHED